MYAQQISLLRAVALVAIVTAVGCLAASPPSLTEVSRARAVIIQAQQAGAADRAPGEFNAAQERLAEAQQLAPTDAELAQWRAREAESDARRALATAQENGS
ncbi:MAG TPA: DUF4398 domain-containing protein [Steroidobacteraceae bacterium]|nr:DUF4398 domain-containing protein [Steroidobacteraceae bacterium]